MISNFIRDEQLSPLAYRGFKLFPFQIAYNNYNRKRSIGINLQRSQYSANSKTNNSVGINYYNFRLSYLRNTNLLLNDTQELLVGAVWQNQFYSRNLDFSKNNFSNLIFFSSSNLMGQVLYSNQISQSLKLQTNITIPLVAYIVRSGYALSSPDKLSNAINPTIWEGLKSGDFATVDRYCGVTINIEFTKIVSEHLMFSLLYNFSYYRDYKHFLFKTASINFGASINYMW